jgi:hypothetical protein
MYFVCVKNNNDITPIPAFDLKLNFDSERTVDEVSFKTIYALNYYSNVIVYLSPFMIDLNATNPVPAIFNFELTINESQHPKFIQSFSDTLLTNDVSKRGKKLNNTLNVLSSSLAVSTFSVYVTFLSTRGSSTPVVGSDGTKFVVYWERSNQRFRIVYNGTSYYVPLTIDSGSTEVFVNAVIVVGPDNKITVYANDQDGEIVSNSVTISSVVNLTFNELNVYADVYNFWFFTYPLGDNVINSLNVIISSGLNQKNVLKNVYTFIINRIKQINPRLYEISGYSTGYKIHGAQVVNVEFKNKLPNLIMKELIETHTDLQVLDFVNTSTLYGIDYLANGSLFVILNDLATKYNLTFFTIHNYVVLANNAQINMGRVIDVIYNKPQLNKSDFDKFGKIINNGVSTEDTKTETFTGNGTATEFTLRYKPLSTEVTVNGVNQELNVNYKVVDNKIVFMNPPPNGTTITVKYTYNLMITAVADKQTSANINVKRNYLPYSDYQTLVLNAVQELRESTRNVYQFIIPMRFDLRPSEVYTIKFVNYYDYHLHIYNESFTEMVNNIIPTITGNVYAIIGYQYPNVDFMKRAYKLEDDGQVQYNFTSFTPSQNWIMRLILKTESYPSTAKTIVTFGNCQFVLNTSGTIDIKVGSSTIATLPATTDWRIIIVQYVNNTYTVVQNGSVINTNSTVDNISDVNSFTINAPCIFDSLIWIKDYIPTSTNDFFALTSNNINTEFNRVYGTLRAFDFDGKKFNAAFQDFDPNLLDIQQRLTKRLESLESLVLKQTNIQNVTSQIENIIMNDLIQMLATSTQNNAENITVNDNTTPSNHRYDGGRTYQDAIWDFTLL